MSGWETFSKFVRYGVGDGPKVNFWHDVWCGVQPLKMSYLDLFSITRYKDAWGADHMQFLNGSTQWNIIFTRPV
jgi:hypothetical protein